jgi:hypothetical protein
VGDLVTLDEAAQHIGRAVVYTPDRYEHAPDGIETGVITAVTSRYVFVRYSTDQHSKATTAAALKLAGSTPNA